MQCRCDSVTVTPGNATVRRNSDLAIRAAVEGFHPREVAVFVRFADRQDWERAPMQPATEQRLALRVPALRGARSAAVLRRCRRHAQRRAQRRCRRSAAHRARAADLRVSAMDRARSERRTRRSRDIRAVEGTNVKVEVFADAPLEAPALIVDGSTGELAQEGRTQHRRDRGHEARPLSDRRARRQRVRGAERRVRDRDRSRREADDRDPQARPRLARHQHRRSAGAHPRRRRFPIARRVAALLGERRRMAGRAAGRRREDQRRRVAAATWKSSALRRRRNSRKRLVPGDLVSYYAVAKDRKATVQTDLFMVQVQPFERRFLQAQGGNSDGGGMGDEQGAISERQREILLATWNLQRGDERGARSKQQLEDSAQDARGAAGDARATGAHAGSTHSRPRIARGRRAHPHVRREPGEAPRV